MVESPTTFSVLVVEDDAEARHHFVAAVESCERLRLNAAVGTLARARRALLEAAPDVLLVDLSLPDGNGIELIREARLIQREVQILVISVFADQDTVVQCVRAGASGYLLKDGAFDHIVRAILDVAAGRAPLSPAVARYVLQIVQGAAPRAHVGATHAAQQAVPILSPREVEVLELLAKGFKTSEIADHLNISIHTAIAHNRNIHKKLEVSSRAEAIFEAVQRGLIRLL
jgi:DNA-binding NarL/FixJ family response regulator